MRCSKYRVQKFLINKTVVYAPQIKIWCFWTDMMRYDYTFGHAGFTNTEEESRAIIEKHKKGVIDSAIFARDCKLARKRFKKEQKIICVE